MKKFFSLTLTLAAMLSAMAVSAQAADYSFETDGTPEYYPSSSYCGNRLSSRCPTLFYRKESAQIPFLHDRVALHEQQPEYLPASGAAAAKP